MGLKAAGDNGAKAQLKTHCAQAFRTYDSLLEARKKIGATREQTACLVDMNVVLMSVPSNVQTLAGFVKIVWGFVEWALGTGWMTILVFDEPASMTNAKRLEQARRDAARNAHTIPCSEDIDPFPFTDDYTREDLEGSEDVMAIRNKRSSRSRLYDEVSKQIFKMASEKAAKWNASGKPEHRTVLVMDGVDIRGCDRPAFERRAVNMISNDENVTELLRRTTAIGEGDLKLQALEDRIRALASPGQPLHGKNGSLELFYSAQNCTHLSIYHLSALHLAHSRTQIHKCTNTWMHNKTKQTKQLWCVKKTYGHWGKRRSN